MAGIEGNPVFFALVLCGLRSSSRSDEPYRSLVRVERPPTEDPPPQVRELNEPPLTCTRKQVLVCHDPQEACDTVRCLVDHCFIDSLRDDEVQPVFEPRCFNYEFECATEIARIPDSQLLRCSEECASLADSLVGHPTERLDGEGERILHQGSILASSYVSPARLFSRNTSLATEFSGGEADV